MTIKCRAEAKRAGVDLAVSRGLIDETTGARNARLFTLPETPDD